MRTISFTGIFLLLTIMACEKNTGDDAGQDQSQQNTSDYFPRAFGSYWVYNSYAIDSAGNQRLVSEHDTVEATGDTVINGNYYSVFYGKRYLFLNDPKKEKLYYRDSLHYIVNEQGSRLLAIDNLSDTLETTSLSPNDSSIFSFSKMENEPSVAWVPAGEFDSMMNRKLTVIYADPPLTGELDNYYAPNVGRILHQNMFVHRFRQKKEYFESRLIDYYIAPE